jgi:hypothetical protein
MPERPTREPSEQPAPAPRRELLLTRSAGILSALAALAALVLILVQLADPPFGSFAFALCISWLVHAACLGMALAMTGSEDPRIGRAMTGGFNLGDPQLDALLVPGRRRWRSLGWVRRTLGQSAAVAWTLAAIYTGQLAVGAYGTPRVVDLGMLLVLLSAGVSSTVCAVAGGCAARREAAFDLQCQLHERCRSDQGWLEQLAEQGPGGRPSEPRDAAVLPLSRRRGGEGVRGA